MHAPTREHTNRLTDRWMVQMLNAIAMGVGWDGEGGDKKAL